MNKEVLELRDRRGVLLDEAAAIEQKATAEKRGFAPEERAAAEAKIAKVKELDDQIKDAEIRAQLAAAKLDDEIRTIPGPRALPVESRKDWELWPQEEGGEFYRMARQFGATKTLPSDLHKDYRALVTSVLDGTYRSITGQGTVVPQDGGFVVPTTVGSVIFQKIHSEGQLISRCNQIPITVGNSTEYNAITENSRASGSRYGGLTVGRVGEGGAITASKAATHRIKLELKKQACAVYLTEEQMSDGPQMLSIINDLVPKAIVFDTEDEIINGLGGGAMEGILNANCVVEVSKETGQAAATVLFENIVKMEARLFAPLRSGAVWLINQDIMPQLRLMTMAVGTGGIPVFLPPNGAAGAPFGTLSGIPIIPVEHMATLGTVGDIVLANLGEYLYATGGGVKTATSMHVRFLNDEQVMKFTQRNDGKAQWSAALTPAKGSNTLSPFVTLATRA